MNDGVCVVAPVNVGGFTRERVHAYVNAVLPGEKQAEDPVAVSVTVSSRKNWPVARVKPSLRSGGATSEIEGFVTFVGVASAQRTRISREESAAFPLFEPTAWAATV